MVARDGGREGAGEERNVWTFYTVSRLFEVFFFPSWVRTQTQLQLFKAQNENQNMEPGAKNQPGCWVLKNATNGGERNPSPRTFWWPERGWEM